MLSCKNQRHDLTNFIEKMESMLQSQLGQEGTHSSVPQQTGNNGATNAGSTGIGNAKNLTTAHPTEGDMSHNVFERNKLNMSLSPVSSKEELKKKSSIIASPMVVQSTPLFVPSAQLRGIQSKTDGLQFEKTTLDSRPLNKSKPAVMSRLTAAAAKAPPFQPRVHMLARRSESDPASDAPTYKSTESVPSSCSDTRLIDSILRNSR